MIKIEWKSNINNNNKYYCYYYYFYYIIEIKIKHKILNIKIEFKYIKFMIISHIIHCKIWFNVINFSDRTKNQNKYEYNVKFSES